MAASTTFAGIGLAYVGFDDVNDELNNYGLEFPYPITVEDQTRIVRASRLIDTLQFKGDSLDAPAEPNTPWHRYPDGTEVPLRVASAVALIAYRLPREGAPVPQPERNPERIRAGDVELEFSPSDEDLDPAKTDDMLMADRLGIPSVAAFRLLRPYLLLPDQLAQDERSRGTVIDAGIFIQVTQGIPAPNLNGELV